MTTRIVPSVALEAAIEKLVAKGGWPRSAGWGPARCCSERSRMR